MNTPSNPSKTSGGQGDDAALLQSMGYAQELMRRMSGFSNFAISFSIICILAGGITSLQLGLCSVGGGAAGILWPLGVAFSAVVAFGMAHIASAFPTAGGLYHWSSALGGKGWGWATAWFNLLGLILVCAAINVGAYALFTSFIGPMVGIDPAKLTATDQAIGVLLITVSQALFNHFGIRVTTLLTDFSGYLIFAVSVILTVAMFFSTPTHDWSRLVTFTNFSGDAGGGVWPENSGLFVMGLLALMWPLYTITGFDASAHTAEETVNASTNVPKGMMRSVYLSGLFGWVMVVSFVLAIPDMAEAAKQGGGIFAWLMEARFPGVFGKVLWVGIVIANYLCGLATVTSTSRMIFAFARDGGLPASGMLRKVHPKFKTPVAAIWVAAFFVVASTLYAKAYSTLTTACVIFLYISYVMPTAAGFFRIGKDWTRMGPFNLGVPLFKTFALISFLGVAGLIWVGVQPPNDQALVVTVAATLLLVAAWWLGVRKLFKGPPVQPLAHTPKPVVVDSVAEVA